jgi:hypothetical protein
MELDIQSTMMTSAPKVDTIRALSTEFLRET